MNCNVYIFGELSLGYTQYPEDSSSHILKKIYSFCKAPTQIAIRRDASMMYYCYIRKLNDNKYFGLSIAVNGYYISRVDELFSLFEDTIEKIAQQGSFIHFTKDGSFTTSTTILKNEEEEIDTLSENLRRDFEALGSSTNILPQVDYTVAKDSVKEFNALDDKRDIVRASYTYGYTFIYKDKDFNTVRVNSYRSVLSQLNEENDNLRKRNEELKEQNTKILRQKKQFKNVIFLILAVIGCGVGLLFLYENLNNTQGQLDEANSTIVERNKVIDAKNNRINNLKNSIDSLQNEFYEEYNKRVAVEEDLTKVCSANPFVVTSCNAFIDRFYFNYYANEEKQITVTLKAINERTSEIITNSHTITIDKGAGKMMLNLLYRLNPSCDYYIVLIYDGRVIAGDRW